MKVRCYPSKNIKKEAVDFSSLFGGKKEDPVKAREDALKYLYTLLSKPYNIFDQKTMQLFNQKIGGYFSPEKAEEYKKFLVKNIVDSFVSFSEIWAIHMIPAETILRQMQEPISDALTQQIIFTAKEIMKIKSKIANDKAAADKAAADKAAADKAAADKAAADKAAADKAAADKAAAVASRSNIQIIRLAANKKTLIDDAMADSILAELKAKETIFATQMRDTLFPSMKGWFVGKIAPTEQKREKPPEKAKRGTAPVSSGGTQVKAENALTKALGIWNSAKKSYDEAVVFAKIYNASGDDNKKNQALKEMINVLKKNFHITVVGKPASITIPSATPATGGGAPA